MEKTHQDDNYRVNLVSDIVIPETEWHAYTELVRMPFRHIAEGANMARNIVFSSGTTRNPMS